MTTEGFTNCDVAVVGGTPGGIAAAVRAAREGLSTVLVAKNAYLGGMMVSGLSFTDTTIEKARSPLHDGFFERVAAHYREEYGVDSTQYERCNDGRFFEPKVAEAVFDAMIEEAGVDVVHEHRPASVERDGLPHPRWRLLSALRAAGAVALVDDRRATGGVRDGSPRLTSQQKHRGGAPNGASLGPVD